MFAVCAITLLCLVAASRSAPLACEDMAKPLDRVDPENYKGRWILVADSMRVIQSAWPVGLSDSVTLDVSNSTFTKANRDGLECSYISHEFSLDGPHYNVSLGPMSNFSGTFYRTSCIDCMVLSFKIDSPHFKTEELCLFSRGRDVDDKVLKEFATQVECLKMPEHTVSDPTKQLCPIQTP